MRALIVTAASIAGAPCAYSQYASGGPKFRGTVKSTDGKPLEGVTVSVRGEGKTFVTTVFTNQQGVYVFPPLEKGLKYSLWAQAQGFGRARLDVNAGSGEIQPVPGLQLEPLKNFEKQLTGVEWMNSFPENTPAEKRERAPPGMGRASRPRRIISCARHFVGVHPHGRLRTFTQPFVQ
jgi:hypothetical protein